MSIDKTKTLDGVFGGAGIQFNKNKIKPSQQTDPKGQSQPNNPSNTKSASGSKPNPDTHKDIVSVITGVYDKTTDFFNKLRKDSEAQLEAKFNDPARKDGVITSHGDVPKMLSFFSDSVKFILDNLDKVPNVQGKFQRSFDDEFRLELEDVKKTLNVVKKAGTIGDVYSAVLAVRQVFIRLATTQKIFDIEPGLANLIDMIKTMRWEDPRSGLSSYFKYNEIGDATVQPDSLLVKPIFLLLVDENLKRRLNSLHVSKAVIDFLGNYSIPSYFLSNELAPAVDGSHLTTAGAAIKTVEQFQWSLNGLKPFVIDDSPSPSRPSVASLTLEDYRKINDQFIREAVERFNTADTGLFTEYSIDVAVLHTLSLWLNSAFKVLVESNMQVLSEVNKGSNFDRERLLSMENNTLLLKLLFEVNEKVDLSSPLPLLFKKINSKLAEQLGEKLPYSDYAYKFLIKEFKTITVSVSAPLHQYYLASNLLGEHKSKIIIAPKLYLPVDLSANHPIDVKIIDSQGRSGIYTHSDALNMMVNINRSFYIPNRDSTVNATITILTPLKLLVNMTKTHFNGLVTKFLENEMVRASDSSSHSLAEIFYSKMSERRSLSAIPPFYYKNRFTGVIPSVIPVTTKSKFVWPFIDQANMKDTVENDSAWSLEVEYSLGDYIRAYYNMHADFSWIEMAMAYTMMTHGAIKGTRPTKKSGTDVTFNESMLSSVISYDGTSTLSPESAATTAGSTFVVEFRNLVRVYYYTLKFVLKEKDGKSISLDYFDANSQKNMKPTLISKDDVYDAYRYAVIKQDSDRLIVDNKLNKRERKDLFLTVDVATGDTAAGILNVTKLLKAGDQLKVTETEVVSQILTKDSLDKSFLIYDENPIVDGEAKTYLEYEPVLIVGTDLVGYRLTGKGSSITNHTEFINNNPNTLVYLTKNFLPFFITHKVVLPTNGKRAKESDGYVINQLKPAFITAHVLSLFGCIEGNYADTLKLLGVGFGLQGDLLSMFVNPKQVMTVTDYSGNRKEYGSTASIWYLPKDLAKPIDGARKYGNIDVTSKGITTTSRFPGYLYLDVDQYNTGLPLHAGHISRVSIEKTRAYYAAFNSVIESGNVDQRLNEDVKGSISLIKITAGASIDNKWDRRIFITPRKIMAILGMEDSNYEPK